MSIAALLREKFGTATGIKVKASIEHKDSDGKLVSLTLEVIYTMQEQEGYVLLTPNWASSPSAFLRRMIEPKIKVKLARATQATVVIHKGSPLSILNRIQLLEKK